MAIAGGDLRVGLVIRAVDQASSTIQQIRRNFNTAFASMSKGAEDATKVWQKAGDLRNAAAGLRDVQHALTGAVMGNVEAFGKFQTAMTEVKVNGGLTGTALAGVEQKMLDIGRNGTFGPTEAANALSSLVKAGYTTDQSLLALNDTMRLAQSESMSLTEAADIMSDTLHQFGKESSYAGMTANALAAAANLSTTDVRGIAEAMKYAAPQAKKFGLSIEDTSAILAGLASKGLKGSLGGTSLDAFLRGLTGSSRIARREISKLRVNGKKFELFDPETKNLRDPLQLLQEFDQALSGMGTGKQAFVAEKIFGEQGTRAFENLRDLMKSGELDKLKNDLREIQGTDLVGSKANEKLNTYEGSVARFNASIETLKISMGRLGGSLAPLITDVADLIGNISKWTEANPGLTKGIMGTVGALGLIAGGLAAVTQGFVFFLGVKGFSAFIAGMRGSAAAASGLGAGATTGAAGVTTLGGAISTIMIPLVAFVAMWESLGLALDEVNKHWEKLNDFGDWADGFKGMKDTFMGDGKMPWMMDPNAGFSGVVKELFDPTTFAQEQVDAEWNAAGQPMVAGGNATRNLRGDLKIEVEDKRITVKPKYSNDFNFDVTNGPNMGGP